MRYLVLMPLVLAACAQPRPATEVSDFEICRYTMRGGDNAMIAQNEANRRGLDCRPLYPAILAQEQQRGQALQDAANYFNRPAPAPTLPQQRNCTSRVVGNTLQTSCW